MIVETDDRIASERLYAEACEFMPGGVNSPVRAFRAVGGTPVFFRRASGCHLFDADGRRYVDYVSSWGAIVHGHADSVTVEAIKDAAEKGTSFGAPHDGEIRLAREILGSVPAEMIRFVNSGTEATVAAIRLARAATGRSKILKFEGNYHGAADCLLAKAGSGVATFSLPDSAGVPAGSTIDTLVVPYNDLAAVARTLTSEVAAVIVEPVAGNMGLVPPVPGFLKGLRELCDQHGALLIFDEVMTGFRIARGGAAERYSIHPDLICYGKVIGGGLPVGAYAGRRDLMSLVAPLGPMYQAGTLSGNPLAMAAGYAAVSRLDTESYERLESLGARLEQGLRQVTSVPVQVQRVGSMISVFFTASPVTNMSEGGVTDRKLFGRVFHLMLDKGFYLPPSALEAWFFTLAHGEDEIDATVEAFGASLKEAS